MTIAVYGEALIDLIAGDDGAYYPHLGGSPFNVAMALARLNVPVRFLSRFSDDAFGKRLVAALREQGVEIGVPDPSPLPTSLAMVTVDEHGQPSYQLYREGVADAQTTVDDVVAGLTNDVTCLHTGSLALTPGQLPKTIEILRTARNREIFISIDLNVRKRATSDLTAYRAGLLQVSTYADLIKASDEDLEFLNLSSDAREAARAIKDRHGGRVFLVTEGSRGAYALTDAIAVAVPGRPPATVGDTVGAGDTFDAAFLSRLYADITAVQDQRWLSDALDFACTAASINVSRIGCSPPTMQDIEAIRNAKPLERDAGRTE